MSLYVHQKADLFSSNPSRETREEKPSEFLSSWCSTRGVAGSRVELAGLLPVLELARRVGVGQLCLELGVRGGAAGCSLEFGLVWIWSWDRLSWCAGLEATSRGVLARVWLFRGKEPDSWSVACLRGECSRLFRGTAACD